jgi:hypothetical protein
VWVERVESGGDAAAARFGHTVGHTPHFSRLTTRIEKRGKEERFVPKVLVESL